MIIKIVCAGNDDFSKLYTKDEGEFLVGVDGGAATLVKNHLNIDLAIGDFDSCSITGVKKRSKAIIIYHPNKDNSDLELALKYVTSKDFSIDYIANKVIEKIVIYNATGKRLDHFLSAMNLVVRYVHFNVEIIDKLNHIFVINSKTTLKKNEYKYVSFFSCDDNTIINLTGFKYQLKNYKLSLFDNLCLSNEIVGESGIVETNNKKLIVMETK